MANTILKLLSLLLVLALVTEYSYAQQSDSLHVDEPLKTGYLELNVTDQDSFYVVINNRFSDVFEIASGDSIELEAGRIHFRIVKQYYMDLQRFITIEENKTHSIGTNLIQAQGNTQRSQQSSYPRLFWEGNNFIQSDPNTDLYVNGENAGTGFAIVDTTRRFEVKGVHPSGREFSTVFTPVEGMQFNYHERYIKPSRSKARMLSILPGGSQLYKKQTLKALAFSVVTIGGAALAYSYETRYQDSKSTYNQLNNQYKTAGNPREAFILGNEAEEAFDEAASIARTRNRIIYGTALIYIANFVDGFIVPSLGYRDESRTINPYLDFDPAYKQPVIGIKSSF